MSVDTNTKGKNLVPYDKVRHPEFTILVSPVLSGMVSRMRVVARGRFVKTLGVEFGDWPAGSDAGTCC
ncbi:MAG TPA: hypothetical protein VMM60_15020 [Ilumatobacter sp.]|nr:hypothetical protein [Ilumatobacter sp.]